MKVCPKCGEIADFNSYFGAYICSNCLWRDDTYNNERIELFRKNFTVEMIQQKSSKKEEILTLK